MSLDDIDVDAHFSRRSRNSLALVSYTLHLENRSTHSLFDLSTVTAISLIFFTARSRASFNPLMMV